MFNSDIYETKCAEKVLKNPIIFTQDQGNRIKNEGITRLLKSSHEQSFLQICRVSAYTPTPFRRSPAHSIVWYQPVKMRPPTTQDEANRIKTRRVVTTLTIIPFSMNKVFNISVNNNRISDLNTENETSSKILQDSQILM